MMQRHYKADGWLGMLLGAKLYINFDGKYTFEHAYKMLLKELSDRGRKDKAGVSNQEHLTAARVESQVRASCVKLVLSGGCSC